MGRAVVMGMRVSKADFERVIIVDEDPDASFLEQEGFEDRLRSYQRGDFHFVGIRAQVELKIPHGATGHSIVQVVQSPGLWGIESDSNVNYFEEVFQEECEVLADMLRAMASIEVQS